MPEYEKELKDSIDFKKILRREIKTDKKKKERLRIIKRKGVTKRIKKLPKELQKNIFIFSMRTFYKRYLLDKKLFSFHNASIKHIERMKKQVIIDNVHILHLECNTLPENKKYIMGCQCDYCKGYPRELKDVIFCHVRGKVNRFIKSMNGNDIDTFCNGVVSPSEFYEYEYNTYAVGYNFMKEGFYSPLDDDPKESPIYFSSEINEIYKI